MWCNRMSTEYAITIQNLNIKGDYSLFGKSVSMEFDLFVNRFDNEFMYATLLKQSAPSIGVEYNQPVDMTWKKVTADYSQDVLGLWEGVDMTGDETYGDAHHRIEYRAEHTPITAGMRQHRRGSHLRMSSTNGTWMVTGSLHAGRTRAAM